MTWEIKKRMATRRPKTQRVMREAFDDVIASKLAAGESPESVAASLFVSPSDVLQVQKRIAKDRLEAASTDRALLRAELQSLLRQSIGAVRSALSSNLDEYQTEDGIDKARLEFDRHNAKIALAALGFCKQVAQEDLLTIAVERSAIVDASPTLFDYVAEVRDDGSTCLSARPRLAIVRQPAESFL